MTSFVTRRARSRLLADVRTGGSDARMRVRAAVVQASGELDAITETGGCPCLAEAASQAVLRDLGMDVTDPETPSQWDAHCRWEDRVLLPMLRVMVSESWVHGDERDRLARDIETIQREHDVFVYPVTAQGEMPDAEVMDRHGQLEIRVLRAYGNRLRKLAGLPIRKDSIAEEASATVGALVGFVHVGATPTADEINAAIESYRKTIRDAGKLYNDAKAKYDAWTKNGSASDQDASALAEMMRAAALAGRDAQTQAEADGRKGFALWVGKAGAFGVAVPAVAPIVVAMGAAAFALYEAGTWFFKAVFGVGAGFSEEWAEHAVNVYNAIAAKGLPVKGFDPAMDVSPKAYVLDLEIGQRMLGPLLFQDMLLTHAGPDPFNAPWRAGAAINKHGKSDPIIQANLIDIQKPGDRDWIRNNGRTTDDTREGEVAHKMVEMVAISAAKDAGLPIATYQSLIDAGSEGWNRGIGMAKSITVRRGDMFSECDNCDAIITKDGSAEALALARIAVEQAIDATVVPTLNETHVPTLRGLYVQKAETKQTAKLVGGATLTVGGAALGLLGLLPGWGAALLGGAGLLTLASATQGATAPPLGAGEGGSSPLAAFHNKPIARPTMDTTVPIRSKLQLTR